VWFNALWLQSVWFSTVLGRSEFLPLAGGLLLLHLACARQRLVELRQLACVGGLGISVDAALSLTGVYQFSGQVLVPLWLCCLWLAFAGALGRSLAYLASRPLLCVLAGAVAFPLNYWAGQRLGAVEFGYSLPLTLVMLALVWGTVLPLMFRLTRQLGEQPQAATL
jgi:hypothetical protein